MVKQKLKNINNHYIKNTHEKDLLVIIKKSEKTLSKVQEKSILKILPEIKKSSKTIVDIIASLSFIIKERPIKLNEDSKKILTLEAKKNIEKIKNSKNKIYEFYSEPIKNKDIINLINIDYKFRKRLKPIIYKFKPNSGYFIKKNYVLKRLKKFFKKYEL